ncbi:hypothetical protein GCM10008938_22100 [Deinococcus roseus]|uniref:Uncharacterized protein n=1 Tax=Deinococcus roseus TaxID=392414 RepID=A0ABQ2D0J8_9DEIO|nr:hypothetical protein GCM10008938_22100 [Deinococcus roseus]
MAQLKDCSTDCTAGVFIAFIIFSATGTEFFLGLLKMGHKDQKKPTSNGLLVV